MPGDSIPLTWELCFCDESATKQACEGQLAHLCRLCACDVAAPSFSLESNWGGTPKGVSGVVGPDAQLVVPSTARVTDSPQVVGARIESRLTV